MGTLPPPPPPPPQPPPPPLSKRRRRLNAAERLLLRIYQLLNRNAVKYITRSYRLRSLIVRFQELGGNIMDVGVCVEASVPTMQPPERRSPISPVMTRRDLAWLAGLGIDARPGVRRLCADALKRARRGDR